MDQPKVKGVPIEYMDIDTLWNDRRDPHANPMSSDPKRTYGRAPGPSALGGMIDQIYRPGVSDNVYKEQTEGLYESGAASGGKERQAMGAGERER